MEKEARLWRSIGNGKVECTACARLCKIPGDSAGFCFVRQNRNGKLYLINYGVLEALQIDPIEKKPFNHFYPGARVLGVGTSSCNFGCLFCQNHNISKVHDIRGVEHTPEEIVELALKHGVDGIAYTYNEPAIFIEYALDVAKIAKKNGLFNVFVSNGYLTSDSVKAMKGLIDAVVVDFKGSGEEKFSNRFEAVVSNEPIKEALIELKKAGIYIEITDLIVTEHGSSIEACDTLTKWIKRNLGSDVPMHFTRFYPDYKMLDSAPTPLEVLEEHCQIAKKNGLNYVYIGNVPGNRRESTYCPKCNNAVVERFGYYINAWNLKDGKCKFCDSEVMMVGEHRKFKNPNIVSIY